MVKFVKSTKSVSITIANFENVVDGIRDEEILSQKFKVSNKQFVFKVKPNCDGENLEASFCYESGKLEAHGDDCYCNGDCGRSATADPGVRFSSLEIKVGDLAHNYKNVKLFKYQHSQGSEDLFSIEECKEHLKEDGSLEVVGEWTAVERHEIETHNSVVSSSWVLRNLYSEGLVDADFTLVCNDGVELAVHKAVLMGASEVTKGMLKSENDEIKKDKGYIDCNHVIVKGLRRFLYTGDVEMETIGGNALEFLKLADHYDLEDLKDRAEGCLLFSLNEENMVKYLIAGDEFHAGKLKGAAKKLVKSKIRVLMVENEWKKIFSGKKDLLIEILADTC